MRQNYLKQFWACLIALLLVISTLSTDGLAMTAYASDDVTMKVVVNSSRTWSDNDPTSVSFTLLANIPALEITGKGRITSSDYKYVISKDNVEITTINEFLESHYSQYNTANSVTVLKKEGGKENQVNPSVEAISGTYQFKLCKGNEVLAQQEVAINEIIFSGNEKTIDYTYEANANSLHMINYDVLAKEGYVIEDFTNTNDSKKYAIAGDNDTAMIQQLENDSNNKSGQTFNLTANYIENKAKAVENLAWTNDDSGDISYKIDDDNYWYRYKLYQTNDKVDSQIAEVLYSTIQKKDGWNAESKTYTRDALGDIYDYAITEPSYFESLKGESEFKVEISVATDQKYVRTAANTKSTASKKYTIERTGKATTPTISGTTPFTGSTTITITADKKDIIYYTTNGSNPSTYSARYTTPITVSADTTIKAIAVNGRKNNSDVASKTFSVQSSSGGSNAGGGSNGSSGGSSKPASGSSGSSSSSGGSSGGSSSNGTTDSPNTDDKKPVDDTSNTDDNTPLQGSNVVSVDTDKGIAQVKDEVMGSVTSVPISSTTEGPVYRMYDASRGEHFYTKNEAEMQALVRAGWKHENSADFTVIAASEEDATPVYRVYNPNSSNGEHNWTTDLNERNMLITAGWSDEGISWRIK